jgi:hypothetical protein
MHAACDQVSSWITNDSRFVVHVITFDVYVPMNPDLRLVPFDQFRKIGRVCSVELGLDTTMLQAVLMWGVMRHNDCWPVEWLSKQSFHSLPLSIVLVNRILWQSLPVFSTSPNEAVVIHVPHACGLGEMPVLPQVVISP